MSHFVAINYLVNNRTISGKLSQEMKKIREFSLNDSLEGWIGLTESIILYPTMNLQQ